MNRFRLWWALLFRACDYCRMPAELAFRGRSGGPVHRSCFDPDHQDIAMGAAYRGRAR